MTEVIIPADQYPKSQFNDNSNNYQAPNNNYQAPTNNYQAPTNNIQVPNNNTLSNNTHNRGCSVPSFLR